MWINNFKSLLFWNSRTRLIHVNTSTPSLFDLTKIWNTHQVSTDASFRSNHRRYSLRKGVLRNFANFTRPATLLKKRFWHRCFPVNFAKFLKLLFLQNTSGRLLLFVLPNNALFTLCGWISFPYFVGTWIRLKRPW